MTAAPMPPLHRHQLAFLSTKGWRRVLDQAQQAAPNDPPNNPPGSPPDGPPDGPLSSPVLACLAHWAAARLPLVVTRQPEAAPDPGLSVRVGLPTPACWGRQPLALQVPTSDIVWFGEFPLLPQVVPLLARNVRGPLQTLGTALDALGVRARAYGSVGWQSLTGLPYLHERSDLDLWLAVDEAEQADAAVAALQRCTCPALRLDGELMFADGGAVAWREWAAWRSGQCRTLLVKRLHGTALEHSVGRFAPAATHAGVA